MRRSGQATSLVGPREKMRDDCERERECAGRGEEHTLFVVALAKKN